MSGYTLYRSLANNEVVSPYIQASMMKNTWPDNVQIPDPHYHDSNEDDWMHPSTHTLLGDKAIYSMIHRDIRVKKRERDYSGHMTPLFGTIYHIVVQQNLINDGYVDKSDVEIALVDEARHWRGHADLMFKGELVDLKTMNSKSYARLTGPYPSWKAQLACYMDVLGLNTSLVVVLEMGSPWGIKELRVNKNQQLLDEIYSKWARVQVALKNNEMPTICCKREDSLYCPLNCGGRLAPKT